MLVVDRVHRKTHNKTCDQIFSIVFIYKFNLKSCYKKLSIKVSIKLLKTISCRLSHFFLFLPVRQSSVVFLPFHHCQYVAKNTGKLTQISFSAGNCFIAKTPENIRFPEVFWRFHGTYNWNNGAKWVNDTGSKPSSSNILDKNGVLKYFTKLAEKKNNSLWIWLDHLWTVTYEVSSLYKVWFFPKSKGIFLNFESFFYFPNKLPTITSLLATVSPYHSDKSILFSFMETLMWRWSWTRTRATSGSASWSFKWGRSFWCSRSFRWSRTPSHWASWRGSASVRWAFWRTWPGSWITFSAPPKIIYI